MFASQSDETSPLYSHDTTLLDEQEITSVTPLHGSSAWVHLLVYVLWYVPTRFLATVLFFSFTRTVKGVKWMVGGMMSVIVGVTGRRQELFPGMEENVCSVSFAGGGMTWIYYLGAAHYVFKTFDVTKIKILASSCGCFGAVPLAIGKDPYEWCTQDWKLCLVHFSSRMLGPLFDSTDFYFRLWDAYLPVDAHIRCTDRLFLSITLFPSLQNKVVSQFASRKDLISCIIASICFPIVYMRDFPTTPYGM